MNTKKMICALLVSGALSGNVIAQQAAPSPSASPAGGIDKEAIAKKLANPIANMISVQTQYQYSRGVGVNQAGSEQSLLFQPVLPFDLGGGDTFIVRPIVAGVREINVQGTSGSAIYRFWYCQRYRRILLCTEYQLLMDLGCWSLCHLAIRQ